jgi:hypothetical protein
MDNLDRLLADAPWCSDLSNAEMRKRHPNWQMVWTPAQMRQMSARGWRLRAIFRSPYYPDGWAGKGKGAPVPVLFYGPATEEERREQTIGSKLAEMVRGDDLRRYGLRR